MAQRNEVVLEGVIKGTPEVTKIHDNKEIMNVLISHKHRNGDIIYNVVLWETATAKYRDVLKDGLLVVAYGHLQRSSVVTQDGKTFYYSKPAITRMEFPDKELQDMMDGHRRFDALFM